MTARPLSLALVLCGSCCPNAGPAPRSGADESAADAPLPAIRQAGPSEWQPTDAIRAAVDAPDRTAEDRALDAGRKPAETMAFFRIAPGQKIAEIFAGSGYTAELLSRVVGPEGVVYGQNSAMLVQGSRGRPWAARLEKPFLSNVRRIDREFDAPLPVDVRDLDAITFILSYHDTVWMRTDRAAMNRAFLAALKPGGVLGIVDHNAREEDGTRVAARLHRISRSVVVREIVAAGFLADAEASFLRNPSDTLDWNDAPGPAGDRRGTSDRFVIRFVKP